MRVFVPVLRRRCVSELRPSAPRRILRQQRIRVRRKSQGGVGVLFPFERTRVGGVFAGDWRDLMRNRLLGYSAHDSAGPTTVWGLVPDGVGSVTIRTRRGEARTLPVTHNFWVTALPLRVEDALPAVTLWRGPDGRISEGFRRRPPRPD